MLLGLTILALGSIFSGFFFKDIFLGVGSVFFFDTIYNITPLSGYATFIEFLFFQHSNI
jgi:hypothetical protein